MHKEKKNLKKLISGIVAGTLAVNLIPGIASDEVSAATAPSATLTVDMTDEQGEIIHGAAGFLYGVSSEDVPTTNTMVPLKPKVLCTKGALGTEHPYGDALDVAKTFLESGGEQVMMYNSNYYGVFGVTADYKDYSEVLENTIAPCVREWKEKWKKEHGTPEAPKDNIGARVDIDEAIIYIPVNEGTPNWGANTDFGITWKSYYEAIHKGDPEATIAGTNDWAYNSAFGYAKDENGNDIQDEEHKYDLDDFLPYCIENNCLPDIFSWHELDQSCIVTMAEHKADFEAKWEKHWGEAIKNGTTDEKQIPKLPQICINEYAMSGDCGVPGRLVNWMARLEETGMYGCLPFWHQANNLNDLAADANEANGAWWAFKWYGDMSGERLAVKSNASYDELYGLATIDDNKQNAKVLFGGQDGGTSVVLKHVDDTEAFKDAEKVHVKVESTSNVGLIGSQTEVPAILEGTFPVNEDGSVIVSVQDAKFSTAYCLTMTKAGEEDSVETPVVSVYQKYYEAEQGTYKGDASLSNSSLTVNTMSYAGPVSYLSDDYAVVMKKDAKLTYTISVPTDGRYELNFIYGNGTGTRRNDPANSLSLNLRQSMQVDNTEAIEMTMNNTLLTNTTGSHREYVDLEAGSHTVTVTSLEEGEVLHDLLIVQYCGAYKQGERLMDTVFEAEHADFNTLLDNKTTTVSTKTDLKGYSGDGYVQGLTKSVEEGGGIRWNILVRESGLYNFTLRYQSANAGAANVYIGNTALTLDRRVLELNTEKSGEAWKTITGTAYLQKGVNIVDVDATTDLALDYLRVNALEKTEEVAAHTTTIEAEDSVPKEAADLIEIGTSAGASGNKYVKGLDGDAKAQTTIGKYLEFVYDAPEAGTYQMQVFQSNDEICGEHSYNTKVIDKYMSFLVTDSTGNELSNNRYFFMNTNSQDTFKEKTIPLTLSKGKNTIRVYNDDSWNVYYGGTQSTPGTDKLDNRTPNIDKFVITPMKLHTAVAQKKQYTINIRTTAGGYVVSAENTVGEGEEFHLTIAPETSIRKVMVDGTEHTADVTENEDGTYALTVGDVQADVSVMVYFQDVDGEHRDSYIKNAGFGTGDTLYWNTEDTKVSVKRDAENSYEGCYAVLDGSSKLSQTIQGTVAGDYFISVYSKGSADAEGTAKLKITTSSGKRLERLINMNNAYQGTAIKVSLRAEEAVTVSLDTSGITKGSVYVDNFSMIAARERDMSQVSRFTQYFVNCGDYNTSTLPSGEKFGARNSVTDQIYGMDSVTGYNWGVVVTEEDSERPIPIFHNGGVWTTYTIPNEWDQTDYDNKNYSYRWTGQRQEELPVKYIRYAFELDPGTYDITIGFQSYWGDRDARRIVANGELIDTVTPDWKDETDGGGGATQYADVKERITISENQNKLLLSIEKDWAQIWVNYIKIETAGEDGDLTEIKALYKEMIQVQDDAQDPYSKGTWNAFTKALDAAKSYAGMDTIARAEQDAVDIAVYNLEKAYKNLKKQSEVIDNNLLYFVDCGDHGITTVSGDDKFGTFNTVTDQVYGTDPSTGKLWGVDDPNGNSSNGAGLTNDEGVYTNYTWAYQENQVGGVAQDDLDKNTTFRYARNQLESGIAPRYITYKFQVDSEDGTYPVEVGLGNIWDNSANPRVYANLGTEAEALVGENLNITNGSHKTVAAEVQASDGFITIDVRSEDPTINLNYIKIGTQKNPPKPTPTVTPTPSEKVYDIFEDVSEEDWYQEYVQYVYEENLMTGLDKTHFGPSDTLLRAQFAVILHRMDGKPEMEYQPLYPDVQEELWYTEAVLWADSVGVVKGYSETGNFGPADYITREQIAVMMYRYAEYKGYDTSKTEALDRYEDVSQVDSFAREAMEWAVGSGIIIGRDDGIKLDPQGNTNRAGVRLFLQDS